MKLFDKITAFFKGFSIKDMIAKQTVGDVLPLVTKLAILSSPDKAFIINSASDFFQKNLDVKVKDIKVKDILAEVEEIDAVKPEPVKPVDPAPVIPPVIEQPKPVEPVKPNDLDCVTDWLDKNIKNWPVTVDLAVELKGDNINFNFKTPKNWKGFTISSGGKILYGNVWVLIKKDGRIFATTFDWFANAHSKGKFTVDEQGKDHMHGYAKLNGWRPIKGEEVGFVVSSRARDGGNNANERSNAVWVTW